MNPFVILTDTTCDLPEAFQKDYEIEVIPGHIVLPSKEDIPAFLKWERFEQKEFYEKLKSDPNGFATAPPNIAECAAAMERFVAQGEGVLMLTISSGISGSYNFACAAKEVVLEKHPDAVIEIVDTLRFGAAIGLLALYASCLRRDGKTLTETAATLESFKNQVHQAGWLDDLSFVAKKGRLTHAKAFLGTLAGVKSIGEFDYNGLTTVIGKIKGAKTAYTVLLNYIEKTVIDPENQIFFISQSNRMDAAMTYKDLLQERFHPKEIHILDVFPSCGINIGPGLMAVYYRGKPISTDLSEERRIIEQIVNGDA